MSIDTPEFWSVVGDIPENWASIIAYIDAQMELDRKDAERQNIKNVNEEWRPVNNQYDVSNLGRVRSIARNGDNGITLFGRVLNPFKKARDILLSAYG